MSVLVNFTGHLGNNLFQYCLGRIIAEHHGYELSYNNRDNNNNSYLENIAPSLFDLNFHIKGKYYNSPIEIHGAENNELVNQFIDLDAILSDKTQRKIVLHGFFQRFEYYAAHTNLIRKWFKCKKQKHPFNIGSNDVLVNLRRGDDYGLLNWILPLTYYSQILDSMQNVGKIYITGIGIDENVHRFFSKYKPIYYTGSTIEHFLFFMNFERIILSNSTFAWWGGFLSNASELYAPRSEDNKIYSFTGFQDVDLHTRETRYHEIPITCNYIKDKSFDKSTRRITIKYMDNTLKTISINDLNLDIVSWIINQKGIVPLSIFTKYWNSNINDFVRILIRSGLIEFIPDTILDLKPKEDPMQIDPCSMYEDYGKQN